MTNEVKNVPELRFPEFDDEWTEKKANEIFNAISDKNHNGDLEVLSASQTQGIIPRSLLEIDIKYNEKSLGNYKKTIPNDFIISLRSFQGGFEINNFTGLVSPAYTVLRFIANDNVSDFFKQYFKMSRFIKKLDSMIYGIRDGKSISFKEFSIFKINLPIKEEQQKIGVFFNKLDRQIELEEQKLAKLEEQKKGYMQKIFSQEFRFKDENDNDYPEWEEKTIKDVYKVTRGYVLARKLMSDNPNSINKYPVYSSQTSNNGLMGYYSDYLYQDGITWTTDGANAGSVSFRQGKFYCTNVCGVLLNELGNSNVCMAEMLNNIAFKYVSKVGNPKLMNNVMAMIKLKFPCLEEQQAISKFLNVFSEVIDNQNKKVELLKERKKGLLQKMFV